MNTPTVSPVTGAGGSSEYLPPDQRRGAVEKVTGSIATAGFGKDPGFQPPYDPLDEGSKFRVSRMYRDIPIPTIQNSWTVADIRSALSQHMNGFFDLSGQLADTMMGDDRVQATLGSRIGGLFGRQVRIKPANGSSAAKEVCDAWQATAEDLLTGWALTESHAYSIFMGFGHGQICWDTTRPIWRPYARPWHPRYEWYEWTSRHYVAISQDGNMPIFPGDGKWYAHEPFGSYRAWVRGAVRAVAEPWAIRHFAIRDWARFSEVHGIPTRVGYCPAAGDAGERSQFEAQLGQLGSETTLLLPRGVDKDMGYDYKLVEAADAAWESFPGLRDHCDLAIVLAIKFQNLTTEIKSGGSYAAAKEHGKGDVAQIAADNRAWKTTIYRDFARPFAFVNFGDADLAPITDLDVPEPPREDYSANAEQFQKFGTALEVMARAGIKFKDVEELRAFAQCQFGLTKLPDFEIHDPPTTTTANAAMVTAKASDKTADASHKTGDASLISANAAKTTAEKPPPKPAPGKVTTKPDGDEK